MNFEFDARKDAANRTKHGISLAEAAQMEWSVMQVRADDRADYGERRWIGAAPLQGRLYVVIFTLRGDNIRVVSLRRANRREIQAYEIENAKR